MPTKTALISVVRGGYGEKTSAFEDIRFYDGKRRGLVDSTGKEIIPSVFAAIEYCGNGIYVAMETLPGHHYHYGSGKRLFNRDGVELSFKLPSGSRLIRVFSLGVEADKDTSINLDQLPKDTLLVCGTEYPLRLGLCDLNGDVVVPPVNSKMVYCRPAQGFLIWKGHA